MSISKVKKGDDVNAQYNKYVDVVMMFYYDQTKWLCFAYIVVVVPKQKWNGIFFAKHPTLVKTNSYFKKLFIKANVPQKEQIFDFKKDGGGCLKTTIDMCWFRVLH